MTMLTTTSGTVAQGAHEQGGPTEFDTVLDLVNVAFLNQNIQYLNFRCEIQVDHSEP